MQQELFFIIDESGSMADRISQVFNGFKEFIQTQKSINDKAVVSVYCFNVEASLIISKKPLHEIDGLPDGSYRPFGCTALYDTMGEVLSTIRDNKTDDNEYIVVVLTDGEENASLKYDRDSLKNLIDDVKHFIKIIYMGSNQDAIFNAQIIGIDTSLTYDDDNLLDAMRSTSEAIGRYRTGESDDIEYTQVERESSISRRG